MRRDDMEGPRATNSSMNLYYKATTALAMGLLTVSVLIGLALGQGGTGRTNTNAAKTASKRTTPARKTGRSARAKPQPTPAPSSRSKSTESELWEAIRNSSDVQDFKDYLSAFPNGPHAVIAQTRIRQLEAAKATPTKSEASESTPLNLPRTRTNATGIEFVLIPPGSFMMGSEEGYSSNETPAHQVKINYSFYMGKYEVTQAQWQSVMGHNPSHFKDCANCPVEQVSWDDAQEFIKKLNQMKDGYNYRLPTEAEWEYACRAGTTGDYADELSMMAWYSNNSENKTHVVGTKQPNAWGLADMHGNVWEWCEDWFHETYEGAPVDGSGWLIGGAQRFRVFRGGSWGFEPVSLRSPNRNFAAPVDRSWYGGFRLVAVALNSTNSSSTNPTSSTGDPFLFPPDTRNLQANDTTETVYKAGEVDQRAQVLEKPAPVYTDAARTNAVTGTVVLRAVLSSTGQVTKITVVRGLPDGLTERSIAAARKIKFKPAMKDGKPVSQYVELHYNLNLY